MAASSQRWVVVSLFALVVVTVSTVNVLVSRSGNFSGRRILATACASSCNYLANGAACVDGSYCQSGTCCNLVCAASCVSSSATSSAATCGNASCDGAEVCDGALKCGAHAADTCATYGYASGSLTCNVSCDGFTYGSCVSSSAPSSAASSSAAPSSAASSSACSTPSAPSAPDLLSASDTGQLGDDNITKTTSNLQFSITCSGTAHFYGGTLGTTFLQDFVCTGSAQTVTVTSTLSAGVHQFNFTQENLCGGISSASISLPVTIDTTAPTVSSYSPTDGATGVSGTTPLVVTFNESIYEGTGNITVYKTSGAVQTYQVAVASTTVGSTSVTTSALTGLVGGTDYYVYTDGIVKDLAGNSFAGISNSATWNFQTGSICGDGVLTGSEECEAGACCDTGTCTLYGGATTCRNSAGVCDLAETCASATVSGVTAACPTDVFQANTQVCNAASGACDIAEYCTGSAAACPSDSYEAAGTTCRVAAGVCDIAETCTGSSPACPADTLHSSGTVCATASDTCGTNATCDGVSTACPSTGYVAGGTLCNAISNLCCSGTSDSCSGSCGGTTPYCGDGTVQSSNAEACDDGNTNSGDGCSASCVNESCGDGIVQPGEACDAGGQNGVSGSGCSSTCTSGGGPGGPNYPGIEYCCPGGYGSNNYCIPKYSTNLANCPGAFSTQASCNAACFPPTTNSSASSAKSVPVGCTQTTLPNGLIGISCSSASVNAGRQVICWDVLNGIMLGIMAPPVCVFPNSIAISNITTIPDFVVRYQLNTDDNCLETYRCSVTSAMGECVPALNSLSSGTVSGGPKLPGNFTSTKPVPPASLGVTAYSYCL